MVSTQLNDINQIASFPQVGVIPIFSGNHHQQLFYDDSRNDWNASTQNSVGSATYNPIDRDGLHDGTHNNHHQQHHGAETAYPTWTQTHLPEPLSILL